VSYLYLLSIVGSMFCMGMVDRHWRLFLFARPARALVVLAVGIVLFLVWDLLAIGLELYRRGESEVMTGIELAPELPLEELFFIAFLSYITMVFHALFLRLLGSRTREATR